MQLSDAELERFRQSGIRLDGQGRFWHEGEQIRHPGLVAALWRWLDQLSTGRWVLRLDETRFVYLDVDDLPFVVATARWEGAQAIGRLSDGTEEPLDLLSVWLDGDRPACRVKGRFPARIGSAAWPVLAERLVEDHGQLCLETPAGLHPLGPA